MGKRKRGRASARWEQDRTEKNKKEAQNNRRQRRRRRRNITRSSSSSGTAKSLGEKCCNVQMQADNCRLILCHSLLFFFLVFCRHPSHHLLSETVSSSFFYSVSSVSSVHCRISLCFLLSSITSIFTAEFPSFFAYSFGGCCCCKKKEERILFHLFLSFYFCCCYCCCFCCSSVQQTKRCNNIIVVISTFQPVFWVLCSNVWRSL